MTPIDPHVASTRAHSDAPPEEQLSAPAPDALPLVRDLFLALNHESVRYCHWKSNLGLPAAMRGETDLDLLIDPSDAHRFREILCRFECKPVISDPSRHFPGLEDWLGLDASHGELIHLHAHYRLVLGEQLIKNHTLPLSRAFLDTTTLHYGVKVPPPALELIVLTLRAMLKCRDRDLLRDLLGIGKGGIPPAILRELRELRSRVDDSVLANSLEEKVSFLEPALILDILRTLDSEPRSGWSLFRLRRRVRKALSPFQRHSWMRARATYYRRMLARELPFRHVLFRLVPTLRKRKTPVSGGIKVAIVGVDGAGKSTVVSEITKFFSWRLVTRRYYMGNRKISISRQFARMAARGAALPWPRILRPAAERLRDLLLAIQSLADARARYRNFRAGQRAAAGGKVVIFDRFPLDAVQIKGHAMDGPRIAWRHSGSAPGFTIRWLAEREERLYRQILLPDLLVVLQISPDVAFARKPDHSLENISAKCDAVSAIRREGLPLLEVDASRPLDEVLTEIKRAVWRLI